MNNRPCCFYYIFSRKGAKDANAFFKSKKKSILVLPVETVFNFFTLKQFQ